MKILGRDVPGKPAAYAAVAACAALILGAALSSSHGGHLLRGDSVLGNGSKNHRILSQAEIDAILAAEEAGAEEKDVNTTESEELEGFFSALDDAHEQMNAASNECVEDVGEYDAVEDGDYNASQAVVPCASDEEVEDLEMQLLELNLELSVFLEGAIESIESGTSDLNAESIYDAYTAVYKHNPALDNLPEDHQGHAYGRRSHALFQKFKTIRAQNEKAKSFNIKAKIAKAESESQSRGQEQGQGHRQVQGQGQGQGKVDENEDTSSAAMNQFTDWDEEDFNEVIFAGNEDIFSAGYADLDAQDIAEVPEDEPGRRNLQEFASQTSFTWKGDTHLGKVVNQGPCGSCYLNGVVTEVESALAIAANEAPLELSREQIKNCQKENYRYASSSPRGCNGGWMQYSYEYIRRNWKAGCTQSQADSTGCDVGTEDKGGITLAEDYPYQAKNLQCAYDSETMDKRAIVGNHVRFSGHTYISPSEVNFKKALERGPIVVALAANGWSWYGGGVKTCSSTSINHAVLLVGWGVENGKKYWHIQNSWGTGWGQNGFIKVERGLNSDGSDRSTRGWRGDKGCGMTVYGGFQSKFIAKVDPTIQDCQGSWSAWSECDQECKGGSQEKIYSITTPASSTGRKCPYPHGYKNSRDCKYTVNMVHDWDTCSATCNGGEQTKKTRIHSETTTCSDEIETRACNTHLCPDSCLIVKDAAYSFMNGNYHQSTGPNNRDRCGGDVTIFTNKEKNDFNLFWYKRKCSSTADGYWGFYKSVGNRGYMWSRRTTEGTSPLAVKWSNDRNDIDITAIDCSLLPVDCDYKWNDWSDCSESCDGGTMTQDYTVLTPPANGGKACPAFKTKTCNAHSCSAKCMKVSNARYSFLNGVYDGKVGGYIESFCGGQTQPRYTMTTVKKYWWRTYTRKYDLVFKNNRCRRSGGVYTALGGSWALGKVYNRRGRTYVGSYDRSPYNWRNYISSGSTEHPNHAGWESSAEMTTDWYKRGVTTVTEVECTS